MHLSLTVMVFISTDMKPITLWTLEEGEEERIFKTFNKTKNMVASDIKAIQEWMKTQPHLPEIMCDNSIINFLIINNFSIEITKKTIDLHYAFKSKVSASLGDINPKAPHMKKVLDTLYATVLPKMSEDLTRVCVVKIRDQDLSRKIRPHHIIGHFIHASEIGLKELLQLRFSSIIDLSQITNEAIKNFEPAMVLKLLPPFLKIYNVPMKEVYIINASPVINIIFTVFKAAMSRKLFQKIHFCNNEKELLDIFPKEILPRDYGGEEKSLEELNDLVKLKFLEYQDRFDEIKNFTVDEKLRPKELENDDFLGFYGNFKQLDID